MTSTLPRILLTTYVVLIVFYIVQKKLENTSSEVGGYIQTMSTNIPVLALLCDADIYCKGFSTEGYLFLETATPVARQGVDFYAKN